jgi:hypothetical protein
VVEDQILREGETDVGDSRGFVDYIPQVDEALTDSRSWRSSRAVG